MQFYSLVITKDFLEGVQGAGKGQVRPEFVICVAFSVTCASLQRPASPVFLSSFACYRLNYITE